MFPARQTGPTVSVASGGVAAVTKPSTLVAVSNPTGTAIGYFTAQPDNTVPTAAIGYPIPAGGVPVHVAIPENAAYYGAFGAALTVTPIEIPRV